MKPTIESVVRVLIPAGSLLLAACGSFGGETPQPTVQSAADIVRVSSAAPSEKCQYLTRIVGLEDRARRIMYQKKARIAEDTKAAMQSKAFTLGGNYVRIDPADEKDNHGLVYLCPGMPAPATARPAVAPATPAPAPIANPPPAGASAVRPSPESGRVQPAQPPSVRSRLEELKSLHEDGLITDEEYEQLRQKVLQNL